MPVLNWTMLWGAIKPKWPLAESWWKKCCSLRRWHSPNRAHMLGFDTHKERRFIFLCFSKWKGAIVSGTWRNLFRRFLRNKIIFATYVQVRDERTLSLHERGQQLCKRPCQPLHTTVCVSIACAKDRSEPVKWSRREAVPWAQAEPHLKSRKQRKRSFINEHIHDFALEDGGEQE